MYRYGYKFYDYSINANYKTSPTTLSNHIAREGYKISIYKLGCKVHFRIINCALFRSHPLASAPESFYIRIISNLIDIISDAVHFVN